MAFVKTYSSFGEYFEGFLNPLISTYSERRRGRAWFQTFAWVTKAAASHELQQRGEAGPNSKQICWNPFESLACFVPEPLSNHIRYLLPGQEGTGNLTHTYLNICTIVYIYICVFFRKLKSVFGFWSVTPTSLHVSKAGRSHPYGFMVPTPKQLPGTAGKGSLDYLALENLNWCLSAWLNLLHVLDFMWSKVQLEMRHLHSRSLGALTISIECAHFLIAILWMLKYLISMKQVALQKLRDCPNEFLYFELPIDPGNTGKIRNPYLKVHPI